MTKEDFFINVEKQIKKLNHTNESLPYLCDFLDDCSKCPICHKCIKLQFFSPHRNNFIKKEYKIYKAEVMRKKLCLKKDFSN